MSILSLKNGISSISGATVKGDFSYFSGGTRALGPSDITGFYSGFDAPNNGYSVYNTYGPSGFTITIATNTSELNYILIRMGGTGGQLASSPYNLLSSTEEYNGSSWVTCGALSIARKELAGAGTQTAGLAFGGDNGLDLSCTEEYNGASWSTGGALITARRALAGAGTQNNGLAFGGNYPGTCTEEYNGSSWSTGGALITGRLYLAGAGTQTAGLAFGGLDGYASSCTEEYF
jgi:hypothetical protein